MPATHDKTRSIEKIFRQVKRLREQMQPGEEPVLAIPGIWDSGKQQRSTPCDIVVTNQRLLGYFSVVLPRPRLFLEELPLAEITAVSLRHKTYEPLFRELQVSVGKRKVYIRAPRRHIEALYSALREANEEYVTAAQATFEDASASADPATIPPPTTVYGRHDIRTTFENSPLAIILLFGGGLVLEILGFALWVATQNIQVGLPLFGAGIAAVITATLLRRQRK